MEVGILFKIGAVGILVSVLCQVLKHSGREEQAFLASLAGLVLVLFWILPYISALFEDIKKLFTILPSKAGSEANCRFAMQGRGKNGGDYMDMLRIAALGTAGVLLGITVKGAKPEFALLVTVGAGLCILAGTVGKMQYLLGMLAQMKSYLPVDSSYLNTLLKMLGITYVGQFSAGICKDAGYSSIAGQIELFARLAVLAVSMPVLLALLETVHDFL